MNKHLIIILSLIVLMSGLTMSAQSPTEYSFNVFSAPTFNNDTAFVNQSEFWVTDSLGPLSDANTTWFSGIGGVLSILESQLSSFIITIGNGNWLALDGSNSPTEEINWGDENLVNVNNLSVNEHVLVEGTINVTDSPNNIAMFFEDGYVVVEG